jgi:hypothetical protein
MVSIGFRGVYLREKGCEATTAQQRERGSALGAHPRSIGVFGVLGSETHMQPTGILIIELSTFEAGHSFHVKRKPLRSS